MQAVFQSKSLHYGIAAVLIVAAVGLVVRVTRTPAPEQITATVERGSVAQIVSVSGVVEAANLAELAFPTTGVVRTVPVDEGDRVEKGQILATLEQRALLADRQDAAAALQAAIADRDELVAGPRSEARDVSATTVSNAAQNLERVKREQAEKVENARRTLRSSGLEAVSLDANERSTPPVVSGTYQCDAEGTYQLEVYSSGASSGYTIRYTGLESGTAPASVEQPTPLGSCGLRLLFTPDDNYNNSEWEIAIPNINASTYVANQNALMLAEEQAQNTIEAAEDALRLATQEATLANAEPRSEALVRAEAAVAQARARLSRIDAQIADRTIVSPFAGTVTDVSVLPGETAGTAPVVTVLSDDAFELTIRIPEIDITKVEVGQLAEVVFDARASELLETTIDFISPSATEIDGVAYYEATLGFTEVPSWLRSGLNADVDIIVEERTDTLRIPKRFLIENNNGSFVRVRAGETHATTTVEVGLVGNDGYVEISGVNEGDIVVAP